MNLLALEDGPEHSTPTEFAGVNRGYYKHRTPTEFSPSRRGLNNDTFGCRRDAELARETEQNIR